ncbi:MAG: acyltransferase family protein [Candidatus Competibacteraceae bacterium]
MNRNNLEPDVRLPGIHGLRAVAALAVVIFHVHGIYQLDLPAYFSLIKTHFGLGVQLFFVLSAFSIFFSTHHRVGRSHWIQDYFIRRFFRIAPFFYLMILVWCTFSSFKFNAHVGKWMKPQEVGAARLLEFWQNPRSTARRTM